MKVYIHNGTVFLAAAATKLEFKDESGQVAICVQFPEIC